MGKERAQGEKRVHVERDSHGGVWIAIQTVLSDGTIVGNDSAYLSASEADTVSRPFTHKRPSTGHVEYGVSW